MEVITLKPITKDTDNTVNQSQLQVITMQVADAKREKTSWFYSWLDKKKWRELVFRAVGLKNSHHFFIQSGVKPKPTGIRSHTFSRALRQLHVITRSFDWFTGFSASLWLARDITLVLVLQHSIEDHSKPSVWRVRSAKTNSFAKLKWKPLYLRN